jgi:hypothetical protein
MRNTLLAVVVAGVLVTVVPTVAAQEFGQGERRDLLKRLETTDLPQGKASIGGGERLMPPGGRSPWHTAGGPKLLYVLEGAMVVEGMGGQTLMSCGPAPKLCFNPHKDLFFFRNTGPGPLKFVVIGIDPVQKLTNHETVGQVTGISGNRVTLAVGDLRSSDLAVPKREVTITVNSSGSISVGDNVVTIRYNEKDHTAESLVKLAKRWQ